MEDTEEYRILRRFRKRDLERILEAEGLEHEDLKHSELVVWLLEEAEEVAETLLSAYELLRGVHIKGAINEIFQHDNALGPVIRDCRTKPQLITELLLAGRLEVLGRVADYVRFVKKRGLSPLTFTGNVRQERLDGINDFLANIVEELNPTRPNALVLERTDYLRELRLVRILLSRERGRVRVRQRPERAPSPELTDHPDYPLRQYVIEVDLEHNSVRTTFPSTDRDGRTITQRLIGEFVELDGDLDEATFRSNFVTADDLVELQERFQAETERHEEDPAVAVTLRALTVAPMTMLSVSGLNIAGDLRKLEVQAANVETAMEALGVDVAALRDATNVQFELQLADGRKVRVSRHRIILSGDFSPVEERAIQDSLLE